MICISVNKLSVFYSSIVNNFIKCHSHALSAYIICQPHIKVEHFLPVFSLIIIRVQNNCIATIAGGIIFF